MKPTIKIDAFNNDLYTVKGSTKNPCTISYIDINHNNHNSNSSNYPSISLNTYTKLCNLKNFTVTINLNNQISNITKIGIDYNTVIYSNFIKLFIEEINKEFVKKVTNLGNINNNINKNINLNLLKKSSIEIIEKIQLVNRLIYNSGRLGPAQYILSNSKNYYEILKICNNHFDVSGENIGSLKYIVNDNVSDDDIIIGRKNDIDQPGLHCIIETDKDNFINIYERTGYNFHNPHNSIDLTIFYSLEEIGKSPEYQYYKLNTNSINYYRYQKLLKLKELYV